MNQMKALLTGILASAVMYVVTLFFLHINAAPFRMQPSEAFFYRLGIASGPGVLSFLAHLAYGACWSLVYVYWFRATGNMNPGSGMATGIALWLFMMVFCGPIIGWGFFGFYAVNSTLLPDDPLYLASVPGYLALTFFLHLIYGAIIGAVNAVWIEQWRDFTESECPFNAQEEEPRLAA